jgi:hypothetical protein
MQFRLNSYTRQNLLRRRVEPIAAVLALVTFVCAAATSRAANQTPTVSPIQLESELPYRIEVRPYSMGTATVPTLHSYAVGEYDGKWVLVAGRTNGLHGFNGAAPDENFPAATQNRDVWVIDVVNWQTWSRPLDAASGLTPAEIASLTPTNNQFYQSGGSLYVTGGYGRDENDEFVTFDTLSAIDVAGLGDWVTNGTGTAADSIRQIHDPLFQVTGGAMYDIDGRTHLVFGQDFQGPYRPASNGVYTSQVRSFDVVDDGVNLSIMDATSSVPEDAYRRRDLNVFPVVRPDGGGGLDQGLVVLSGVFTLTNGAWTVPVEIDATGNPTMADPNDPNAFKQGFNNYHSAKLGLFSELTGAMHEVLFGGISLQFRDEATDMVVLDNQLPFVNDITAVVIDADGNFSQHHLGWFPELTDLAGNRIRFGANAEFLPADGIAAYQNGVIDLDQLAGQTVLGHIFGGLAANAPHTRVSPSTLSSASNLVWEVVLTPVPEPATWSLGCALIAAIASWRRTLGAARRR